MRCHEAEGKTVSPALWIRTALTPSGAAGTDSKQVVPSASFTRVVGERRGIGAAECRSHQVSVVSMKPQLFVPT
jgi:hypothetical protein